MPTAAILAGVLLAQLGFDTPQTPPDIRFGERVEVERVIVDARAVDSFGRPILGLASGDFEVKVDGQAVELESVTWVAPSSTPTSAGPAEAKTPEPWQPTLTGGRLVVFFFQKDLHHSRLPGFLRMLKEAQRLVADLTAQDRVAIFSFDSHLKLWLDFGADRERARDVLKRSLIFEDRPGELAPGDPSLASHFDRAAAQKAASPEEALTVAAWALQGLPGTKTLVMFGHGFGNFSPGLGVRLSDDYETARRALAEARVTVLSLDVTNADHHSLEAGLQQVAEDTGGFFARTHLFPGEAMERVRHALAGHYVLTFVKPRLPPGEHALDIRLSAKKGSVLAKSHYRG
jgi:VWFA-related protein